MKVNKILWSITAVLVGLNSSLSVAKSSDDSSETMVVESTAEQLLKQQPGVSIITREDIEKNPPVNDLSEIIRKMPGVNLTGNSASGTRGNNRQIDIRGMGPENTLVLIDGVPVTSRNSVRYSWRGERDTRGDTNWVPPEQVERIEVIRGPAAARYGSGAAGGVVNIITKRPTNDWHGSLSLYTNQPENSKEGDTRRGNFSLSGPLTGDALTMRLYGNLNRTDADRWDINSSAGSKNAAGREGVTNKDINGVFSWKITPQQILDFEAGYSRQGNIYAGDTQNSSSSAVTKNLAQSGQETNRLYRQNYGLTHNGIWDWGQSRLGFYYEKTNNTRMDEGLSGGGEGRITNDQQFTTNRLTSYRTSGELNFPMRLLFEQTLTVGAEWNRDELDDPSSMGLTAKENNIGGVSGSAANRSSKNKSEISALYVEDNIEPVAGSNIIPGLRFDYLSKSSGNFSPSLNLSQELGEYVKVKAGIARAFKAPNLYQTSEGYLLFSKGNGCPKDITSGGCYLLGNKNLDPEISINKEIGLELAVDDYHASLTYFRNDYQNKIVAGDNVIGKTSSGAYILQWQNGGKALIEGLEASMAIPLEEDRLSWNTNATYMITSEQKDTGNPLSIIPKYTVNTSLDWNITSSISAGINWTLYGKQKPRTHAESRSEDTGGLSGKELGAYSLVGTNVNYDINKNLRLNVGISNIFDKQIYRSTEGANTYNEPGRAYYAGVTASF
ncbi:TonB-dependent siderophore receptor [Salmonella enterica subsp. enterica serovar Lexington]|uniref:TonB-dependent siderophore receptor n=1 Tax=Salmonella enterica TaxID=28901 RepID=UPI000F91D6BA|nr:TonB-dependent siderophore receptor [Salmonella enterica subsp. enterica serovar Lexington]EAA5922456.1 TonB-dependent siderophore receptor [Salmonella enterica]EBH8913040.1 TonB-dependent siderophore receptor [Salmonella enterica subsp. enterica serovar Teko]MIG58806.1 TonB-dependent siderophore receptor [Salmonella enterica subsp. houtenae]EAA7875459.1 TonB-dependent siderophore receptor [Salmonella enterica subsp. enterica serovar Lexington]